MTRLTPALCAASLALLPLLPAQADPMNLKLGLWESTQTTQMSGSPIPEAALQKMTPEQRARVEAAMKKREAMGPRTHVIRSCLTQEKLERPFVRNEDEDPGHCRRTVVTATRTVHEYRFQCSTPEERTGVMRLEAQSSERVTGTLKMKSAHGSVSMQLDGHWVAASCGKEKG